MKKINFLLLLALSALLVNYSCNNENGNENENLPEETVSDLTPEEHKQNLQDEAIAFIDDMDPIRDADAIDVLIHFVEIAEDGNGLKSTQLENVIIGQVIQMKDKPANAVHFKSGLAEDGPDSFSEMFDEIKGEYTYNAIDKNWTKEEHDTEMIVHFPASADAAANNAEFRIYDFTYELASRQDIEGFTLELINSLKMDLKVDGSSVMSFVFSGEYYDDTTPKLITEVLTIGSYSWEHSINFTDKTKLLANTSMKNGDNAIWSAAIESEGNFDYDNIKENITDEEGDEHNIPNIFSNAKASFTIENIMAEAEITNFSNLIDGIDEAEAIEDEEASYNTLAEVLNENVSVVIKYAEQNEVIATGEFYAFSDQEYNYWTEQDETYYDISFRMIFSDDSYMDDSYFENGFSGLIDRLNELISSMNNDYDLDMEPVEE